MKISLSPSAASRWLNCTASPRFIAVNAAKLPKDGSVWADEGTVAHTYAAASILIGWDEGLFAADHESMVEPVKLWHDYAKAHILSENDTVLVEQKLPLFYYPERNGITDLGIVNRDADLRPTRLCVFDYKHGEGVTVEAVDNDQLLIYARNIMLNIGEALSGDLPVKLAIVQPRCREGDKVKVWELTVDELRSRAEAIEETAKLILSDVELCETSLMNFKHSDKTCQFCPAQAICPEFAKAALTVVQEDTPIIELPQVESLSLEHLGRIQSCASVLTKYLAAVKEHLLALGTEGKLPETTGFKVVAGSAHRKWSDDAEAQRLLVNVVRKSEPELTIHEARDKVAPRYVLSVAEAEKLLKKVSDVVPSRTTNMVKQLITKPEGAPTLAPVDDKRPALNPVSDFVDESLL